ncbi:cytochrome b-like [Schistocerca americana]|uniref:cytochrome b-like n=1 Tax=Schistocerca americana TaxID=7009 RepID=UPI001F4FC563|nr:cytochrome b-like [Schistocerca americana]
MFEEITTVILFVDVLKGPMYNTSFVSWLCFDYVSSCHCLVHELIFAVLRDNFLDTPCCFQGFLHFVFQSAYPSIVVQNLKLLIKSLLIKICLINPYLVEDPDNFVPANPLETPVDIRPEL